MNCPFCGASIDGHSHNGSQKHYSCGSWVPGDFEDRTRKCYDRQLSQQADLIRKAAEAIRLILKHVSCKSINMCDCDDPDKGLRSAQALFPLLEAAVVVNHTSPDYQPKTPLGKKLMAIREKAIANGMKTLSVEGITGENMVIVRRDYAEQILSALEDETIEYIRLKEALGENHD